MDDVDFDMDDFFRGLCEDAKKIESQYIQQYQTDFKVDKAEAEEMLKEAQSSAMRHFMPKKTKAHLEAEVEYKKENRRK